VENTDKNLQLHDRALRVLTADDIAAVLAGQELAVMEAVSTAYKAHNKGDSSLPHSTFLRFPDDPAKRIIALPGYLGGAVNSSGLKWIASFPGNVMEGDDRASAVLILNSARSGRPTAILECSMISAWRTAASAALAARRLACGPVISAGLVGCGVINFAIVRFLRVACPDLDRIILYDLDQASAEAFEKRCCKEFSGLRVEVADSCETVLRQSELISFATTAGSPYVQSLSMCPQKAVVLHVSLRDLMPQVILAGDNIVDDIDHVCRAQTSIHLTEQQTGHRGFVRCTLADILNGEAAPRDNFERLCIFSPFGLGILDIAVGEFVLRRARESQLGSVIPSFLPQPWRRDKDGAAT
jgi:ornithine cyclodeaminase